jgi:hypothetical protein
MLSSVKMAVHFELYNSGLKRAEKSVKPSMMRLDQAGHRWRA